MRAWRATRMRDLQQSTLSLQTGGPLRDASERGALSETSGDWSSSLFANPEETSKSKGLAPAGCCLEVWSPRLFCTGLLAALPLDVLEPIGAIGIAVDGSRPTARGPCVQVCGAGSLGGKKRDVSSSHGHGTLRD